MGEPWTSGRVRRFLPTFGAAVFLVLFAGALMVLGGPGVLLQPVVIKLAGAALGIALVVRAAHRYPSLFRKVFPWLLILIIGAASWRAISNAVLPSSTAWYWTTAWPEILKLMLYVLGAAAGVALPGAVFGFLYRRTPRLANNAENTAAFLLLFTAVVMAPGWIVYRSGWKPFFEFILQAAAWPILAVALYAGVHVALALLLTTLRRAWCSAVMRERGWPRIWMLPRSLLRMPDQFWRRLPAYEDFSMTPSASSGAGVREHLRTALLVLMYWEQEQERERIYQARKGRRQSSGSNDAAEADGVP